MKYKISRLRIQQAQKGSVLIIALALVAMIEVILMGIVLEHRISVRHTTNYLDSIEAIQWILGAEEHAKAKAIELYSDPIPFFEKFALVESSKTSAVHTQLWDAQSLFNINSITKKDGIEDTNRFLSLLIPNDEEMKNNIIDNIIKTKNIQPDKDNTFNSRPFISISELRSTPDMDSNLYNVLAENISTLKTQTKLNVNQASELALTSLAPEITTETALSIIALKNSMSGFTSIEAFTSLPPLQNIKIDKKNITVKSNYYWGITTVELNNIQLQVFSLIRINENNKILTAQIVYRSFGGR